MRRSIIRPLLHGHTTLHLLVRLPLGKDLVKIIEKLILIGRRSERRGIRRKGMPICSNAHTSHVAPEPLDVFIAKIEACLGRHLAARRRRRRRSGGAGDGGGGGRERREEL